MSRTKGGKVDQLYGLVVLTCPNGDELGKVLLQPPGRWVLSGDGWMSERPLDLPLRMQCRACRAKGICHDLRGSWDKVKALAVELENNPTRGRTKYVLGG
ncbi:hypothetical protein NicSoilB11_25940 [Arthrobacter sp. NicSoilB11]|nr:hypothetical protein NicSoilB11_25940 [Arthrobacter sp. NicSoilB11]